MKPENIRLTVIGGVAILILLSACGPSQAELDATSTGIAHDNFSTQTAQAPTATNTPTDTPIPTATATATAKPTLTPTTPPTATPTVEPGAFITSTLENGWINYESQTDGFTIALPPEWIPINLNPDTLDDALAVSGELNPEIGGLLTSEKLRNLIAAGIKFYALEVSQESLNLGLPPSANLLMVDLGLELPLDLLVPASIQQLESIADPEIPIAHQLVTLSNHEAAEITYVTDVVGIGGDPVSMMLMQYIMVDGTMQYVLTLGAPAELADSYSDILKDIAKSFQLLE